LNAEKALGQKALQTLVDRYDYHETGGAPLLGIDGTCIICHGSSGDRAIKNALGVAAQYAGSPLNEIIVQELAASPAMAAEEDDSTDHKDTKHTKKPQRTS
jgi:glycerol-3-phosphate acyltransferase PlsX